jgi:ribosomal protein S12 methylthiotransferase accessory factor
VADARRFAPVSVDLVAMGAAFDDEERARRSAIGEAVERYCGNLVPVAGLRRASYSELVRQGEVAVDPMSLALYSDAQYAEPGFPFVRFTRELEVQWKAGVRLADGRPCWVPASLAYINYFNGRQAAEPRTNFVMYSGIAAGESREQAELSGLLEVIERDATMIWWHSGSPCEGINPEDPSIRALLASPWDRGTLRYSVFRIPSRFPLPVIGVLCEDTGRQLVSLGMACRLNPVEALSKAAAEAVHLWTFALGLLDPDGHIWKAITAGIFDARSYQPYRADRRYRDGFRPDYHDMVDLGSNAQYYLDPRTHYLVDRIREAPPRLSPGELPSVGGSAAGARDQVVAFLVAEGFEPVSVDLTTSDVASAGLAVVRVVVPGLVPNGPAAFPFLGSPRIREEPARLGLLPEPIGERDLVLAPLPHT